MTPPVMPDIQANRPASATIIPQRPYSQLVARKQIKRNRARLSCERCRARRVKCDKVHPICGGCTRRLASCAYVEDDSQTQKQHRSLVSKSRSPEQDLQLNRKPSVHADEGRSATPSPRTSPEKSAGRYSSLIDLSSRDLHSKQITTDSNRAGNTRAPSPANAQGGNHIEQQDAQNGSKSRTQPASLQAISPSQPRRKSLKIDGPRLRAGEFALPIGGKDDDVFGSCNIGRLGLQGDAQSRSIGTTYKAYFFGGLDRLNRNLSDQTGSASSRNSLIQRLPSPGNHSPQIPLEILEGIPLQAQSNVLLRCWLSGFHLFHPLYDMSKLLDEYHKFWNWFEYRQDADAPDPQYVPLYFAIWSAGSTCISNEGMDTWFTGVERGALSAHFQGRMKKCLALLSFPQVATLQSLSAFLTVLTIQESDQDALSTGIELGLALRVAQTMGLHRDAQLFDLEYWEITTRRQVWWHIMQTDSALALATGLPTLVDDRDDWDTKSAAQVEEMKSKQSRLLMNAKVECTKRVFKKRATRSFEPRECLSSGTNPKSFLTRETSPFELRLPFSPPPALSMAGLTKSKGATRQLVKIRLGTKPISSKDMDNARSILSALERDVRVITNTASALETVLSRTNSAEISSRQSPSPDTSPTMLQEPTHFELGLQSSLKQGDMEVSTVEYYICCLSSFLRWLRLYLLLVIDKLYCLLYQPFLKSSKSELWKLARKSALSHSQNLIRNFTLLASDPAFRPFQWKRPGTHWPMHAAMIILVDLYERPNSKEAPILRALIDELFELSGLVIGKEIAEDNEEWHMLLRLRSSVWQRESLNPEIYWTKEQHLQASGSLPREPAPSVTTSAKRPAVATCHLGQAQTLFEAGHVPGSVSYRANDPSSTFPIDLQGSGCNSRKPVEETMTYIPHAPPYAPSGEVDELLDSQGYDPRFDWEAWDTVFGQKAPMDFSVDAWVWTDAASGSGSDYIGDV